MQKPKNYLQILFYCYITIFLTKRYWKLGDKQKCETTSWLTKRLTHGTGAKIHRITNIGGTYPNLLTYLIMKKTKQNKRIGNADKTRGWIGTSACGFCRPDTWQSAFQTKARSWLWCSVYWAQQVKTKVERRTLGSIGNFLFSGNADRVQD
jgi:hypothetical protein